MYYKTFLIGNVYKMDRYVLGKCLCYCQSLSLNNCLTHNSYKQIVHSHGHERLLWEYKLGKKTLDYLLGLSVQKIIEFRNFDNTMITEDNRGLYNKNILRIVRDDCK